MARELTPGELAWKDQFIRTVLDEIRWPLSPEALAILEDLEEALSRDGLEES